MCASLALDHIHDNTLRFAWFNAPMNIANLYKQEQIKIKWIVLHVTETTSVMPSQVIYTYKICTLLSYRANTKLKLSEKTKKFVEAANKQATESTSSHEMGNS